MNLTNQTLFTQWKIKQFKSRLTKDNNISFIVSINSAENQDIILSVVLPYKKSHVEGFVRIEKFSGSVSLLE